MNDLSSTRVHAHAEAPIGAVAVADVFDAVYELMFEMVEMLISRTGYLRHELVGFEFEGDVALPARAVRVGQSEVLQRLMEQMLAQWPIVAHIFQGWSLPDASAAGYQHVRCEVIVIALHDHQRVRTATCKVHRMAALPDAAQRAPRSGVSMRLEKGMLRPVLETLTPTLVRG